MQEPTAAAVEALDGGAETSTRAQRRPTLERLTGLLPGPRSTLMLLLLISLLVRVGWLNSPRDSLIFDEAYYVNAARVILDLPVPTEAAYANAPKGIDPNREHPPLGKLMMSGSMKVFGDNALGWRFPSIVTGMLSILLVYGIARLLGGDEWLAVMAATLYSFDNLVLVHSRIGTLDMPLVMFMLLGGWCYLRGWPLLGGTACALAALTKLGGAYAIGAILLYEGVHVARAWWSTEVWPRERLFKAAQLMVGFFVVLMGGLWLMDLWVTTYNTPWSHINFMLKYALELTRDNGPANQESYPWQWLMNEVPMTYMRVDEQVKAGEEIIEARALIYFRGAMNPIIIGAAPIAMAYAGWRAWKLKDDMALWTMAWIAGTFLPFVPASMFAHRISYLFYFLPTLPGIAIALALFFQRSELPKIVTWVFLLAVFVGFIGYYPIRRF